MNIGTTQASRKYRYGYQGEFAEDETDETGFNSFEARMYDPVIGRWLSVDPHRQFASGYVGMGNNPLNGVDPDGRDWFRNPSTGKYEWFNFSSSTFEDNSGDMWIQTSSDPNWDPIVRNGIRSAQSDAAPIAFGLVGFAGFTIASSYSLISITDAAIEFAFQSAGKLISLEPSSYDLYDLGVGSVSNSATSFLPAKYKFVAGVLLNSTTYFFDATTDRGIYEVNKNEKVINTAMGVSAVTVIVANTKLGKYLRTGFDHPEEMDFVTNVFNNSAEILFRGGGEHLKSKWLNQPPQ